MPVTSSKQYGAMQAAAHGKSNLGIPQKVGAEMIHKTPAHKRSMFAKKLAKKRKGRGKKSERFDQLQKMSKGY